MAAHLHAEIRDLMYGNEVQKALATYWEELDIYHMDSYDCELSLHQLHSSWEVFQLHLIRAFHRITSSELQLKDSFVNRLMTIRGYAERASGGLRQLTVASQEHQEELVREHLLFFTSQFLSLQEELRYTGAELRKMAQPRRRWWQR